VFGEDQPETERRHSHVTNSDRTVQDHTSRRCTEFVVVIFLIDDDDERLVYPVMTARSTHINYMADEASSSPDSIPESRQNPPQFGTAFSCA
jgi:hypothetical protein